MFLLHLSYHMQRLVSSKVRLKFLKTLFQLGTLRGLGTIC